MLIRLACDASPYGLGAVIPIPDSTGVSAPTVTECVPVVSTSVGSVPPPRRRQGIRGAPRHMQDCEH